MEEISQLKEKVAEELGQYKSSKVNYSQMERDMLYEVAIKLNGILASKSRLKKVELDKESQQLITQQNKVADTKNKLDTTELKTVVQNQIVALPLALSLSSSRSHRLALPASLRDSPPLPHSPSFGTHLAFSAGWARLV